MMELSRRKLLVAAGAAAAAVPAAHAAQDPSLSDNVPKKWDRTVKLLIVGAGGAGRVRCAERSHRHAHS